MVAHEAHNLGVVGSSPTPATIAQSARKVLKDTSIGKKIVRE